MRIYSVDAADPFLPTLAERLCDGTLWPDGRLPDRPFALAEATVYLPTRRAARALGTALLDASPSGATALPRIETLGDGEDPSQSEVISALETRAILASLIEAWVRARRAAGQPGVPAGAPDVVRLAEELRLLIDQVETQEADWSALPALVEDADLAAHWATTTDFLTIATQAWPQHLEQLGRIAPSAVRGGDPDAVAAARGPMIVAGSTGSIPATRRLMRAICESPWGVLVLPGLDRGPDAADWAALREAADAPGHPQYGLHQLLEALDVAPREVSRLAPSRSAPGSVEARGALLSAAFRPAPTTDHWLADRAAIGNLAPALADVTLVDAPDERTEAAAVAVAMREALEHGGTVALVTPHRALARRVSHALARFGLAVDDSGGEPLLSSPAGVLTRLVAAVASGAGAAEWLALLKHPRFSCGLPRETVRAAIPRIDCMFRGPRIAAGAVLAKMAEIDAAAELAAALGRALSPLTLLSERQPVAVWAAAQHDATAAIAGGGLSGPDGEAIAAVLTLLAARDELTVDPRDWPATFEALLAGEVLRAPPADGAVRILGPLEARLQSFDHVVLGGLNEGTWPGSADAGPWMSRGMMRAFGIDLPERRIGLSAHDVFVAAHHPSVTLTRAKRAAGEPTVASRWWQRLIAFAGADAEPALRRGARLIGLAETLDARDPVPPPDRPAPRPPIKARPRDFSFTEVGRLVRDPYAVYAKRVLRLAPLDDLEMDAGARDKGILVHAILAQFVREGHHLAADAEARFHRLVGEALRKFDHAPEMQAVWGARLRLIAEAVVVAERERAADVAKSLVEVAAKAEIGDGAVSLHGRIDRIDVGAQGAEVIDYKTGAAPSDKTMKAFLDPQLPLEAALVRGGAVEGVAAGTPVVALTHVEVGRGLEPLKRKVADLDPDKAADEALARFLALVKHYADPGTGYLSRARVEFERDIVGDYDHLARVDEWQAG